MLKVEKLSKKFVGNDFYSLRDVSFEVKKGEIIGLIGKNGAGKSTLLKMIAKSLRPTEGEIFYKGESVFEKDNILHDVGIMIDPVFYPEMTVIDNLKFYLRLHRREDLFDNIEPTLKMVELWDARHRKPKGFSFGMKQRTALAIALVAEPDFLLLDEPFVGLDPVGIQKLIEILQEWSSQRQISMIISSHQLGELEALCDRYIYIDSGRLADSFEGQNHPSVVFNLDKDKDLSMLQGILSDNIQLQDSHLEVSTAINQVDLQEMLMLLVQHQLIESMEIRENHLKDIFMRG